MYGERVAVCQEKMPIYDVEVSIPMHRDGIHIWNCVANEGATAQAAFDPRIFSKLQIINSRCGTAEHHIFFLFREISHNFLKTVPDHVIGD